MNRIWMNEGDLEPEQAAARLDRRSARRPARRDAASAARTSSTSYATWCIPGPRFARKRPTGVSVAERAEQLDAARRRRGSTPPRRPAPRRARDARAGRRTGARTCDRLVEVLDRDADVVDPSWRLHVRDATVERLAATMRASAPALVLSARATRAAAAAAADSKSNGEATKTAEQVVARREGGRDERERVPRLRARSSRAGHR